MKAPSFWQGINIWTKLLSPVARNYEMIVQHKLKRSPQHRSRLPVICVGNVTMGGSGKTPVVDAIAQLLIEQGSKPAILMRGYGGKEKGPLWINADMPADLCGDEALLHARIAPTLVSRNRALGAQEIEKRSDLTHIVMDDGLQNATLQKTKSLIVIDGKNPFGNGLIFPAGPLREKLETALSRVQALVILGEDRFHLATQYQFLLPVFRAAIQPVNGHEFAGKPVIAFAGIGNPTKFFQSLKDSDAVLINGYEFADHHFYKPREIQKMIDEANRINVLLVTTRKDWVRLSPQHQAQITVLDVAIKWEDEQSIRDFLSLGPT